MIPPGAPIVTAEEMRAAEEEAFLRQRQDDVMERAGAAVAREVVRFALGRPVLVLAGPGNNGGDAYVCARLLQTAGLDVAVAALGDPKPGSAAEMAYRWTGPVASLYEARARPVIVDGLFGTGMTRPLERSVQAIFNHLCHDADLVVAIDLPSGLDTDSGAHLGAPRVDVTVALGALKPAHLTGAGLDCCGEVILADIGVPVPMRRRVVARPRLSAPGTQAHKYTRGLVAVIEGAMPGAARLAARAAMAGGAGYVVLAGPDVGGGGPDALVRHPVGHPEDLGAWLADDRLSAVVIGPGLGRDRRAELLLKAALDCPHPLVVDGDALTLMGRTAGRWLSGRSAPSWLTPHAGEFERMFPEAQGSKLDRTLAAAAETNATVIHKGADTVIAAPNGEMRVLSRASSWLSTAGTGDVLAGLVAAQAGLGEIEAAEAAVWLHGRAAGLAGPAFIADRLIDHVPQAIAECL
ncbi:NAD(P)H-hydrate dehydratase [Sphingomonas sp.]|uniref:NAD(P)H-hydrate dehydratase n=1 Tax=Sphingomonas sp. TaxID=28214 RepID=UPI001B0920C9|nr:NAD(P)H-hydrate dehydratase [Sphingomonas sp.]MBO9711795.1 NAD(P)H-hydrate dehydratase [Sphingomonas sp.]